jgi:hypothetical protein
LDKKRTAPEPLFQEFEQFHSYLNFVRFRALTLGDICFEQNCKKVQDLVDELCDFEASK